MHIHFVSFVGLAPGAEQQVKYLGQMDNLIIRQKVLSDSALANGDVDHVHNYNREKLLTTDYYKKNKPLLDEPIGCGFWAWKPYIILQTLAKTKPNDYVIYCDVGKPVESAKTDHGNVITTSLKPLIEWAERNNGMLPGVYLSNHGPSKHWIKRDCFTLMECDDERYHQMPTVQAGYTVWKNTSVVIDFLNQWQALNLDERLISDQGNTLGQKNHSGFVRNCHDQATLTLLCEKKGVSVFGDRNNQFLGFRNINFIAHQAAYQNALSNNALVLNSINKVSKVAPNYVVRWIELLFAYRRNEFLDIAIIGELDKSKKQGLQNYFTKATIKKINVNTSILDTAGQRYDLVIAFSLSANYFTNRLLLNAYNILKRDGVFFLGPLPASDSNVKSEFEVAARSISSNGRFPSNKMYSSVSSILPNPKIPNSRNPIFISGKGLNGQIENLCIMIKPSNIKGKIADETKQVNQNHKIVEPTRPKGLPPLPKVSQLAMLVDDENYSQVDLYAQHILRVLPDDPYANLACAWVASKFGFYQHQQRYLQTAIGVVANQTKSLELIAVDLHIDLTLLLDFTGSKKIDQKLASKYHVAKAWGFGLGSEMSALMGQAYLAEVCERELVVHWGSNFLYRSEAGNDCVFNCYFEKFNDLTIKNIEENFNSIYPPKWTKKTIYTENLSKRKGPYSKLSSLYFFNRSEKITVSDYYAGVINIKPWVDKNSALYNLSFDDTYRYLAKKYLVPQKNIIEEVNNFINNNIPEAFIAVHARGSDKDEGYKALTSIPGQTLQCAKDRLSGMPKSTKLFLMTDDTNLLTVYQKEFGDRLVQTECQRCDTEVGVHYDDATNKLQAGKEMLIDMLVAARASCFIGLGLSNPSQLITYFGNFDENDYILFGGNSLKNFNTHLYKTISVR